MGSPANLTFYAQPHLQKRTGVPFWKPLTSFSRRCKRLKHQVVDAFWGSLRVFSRARLFQIKTSWRSSSTITHWILPPMSTQRPSCWTVLVLSLWCRRNLMGFFTGALSHRNTTLSGVSFTDRKESMAPQRDAGFMKGLFTELLQSLLCLIVLQRICCATPSLSSIIVVQWKMFFFEKDLLLVGHPF